MKIILLGCGAWGYTNACLLNEDRKNTIFAFDPDQTKLKNLKKLNSPRITLIDQFKDIPFSSADIIIFAIPFKFIRSTLKKIKPLYTNQVIVNLSKGIENKTCKTASKIICEILNTQNAVTLTGPTHAEEVNKKIPSAIISASADSTLSALVQTLFNREYFRVYTSDDISGAELGGAIKNVIAIAAGISDGLSYGANTKAALLTRGINEMLQLSKLYKCNPNTFFGLSGFGDLMTTCFSPFSRNRNFGELIGRGCKPKEAIHNIKEVVEGYYTVKTLHQISLKFNLDLPISNEVYKIVYYRKSPFKSVNSLMTRELKKEF